MPEAAHWNPAWCKSVPVGLNTTDFAEFAGFRMTAKICAASFECGVSPEHMHGICDAAFLESGRKGV